MKGIKLTESSYYHNFFMILFPQLIYGNSVWDGVVQIEDIQMEKS